MVNIKALFYFQKLAKIYIDDESKTEFSGNDLARTLIIIEKIRISANGDTKLYNDEIINIGSIALVALYRSNTRVYYEYAKGDGIEPESEKDIAFKEYSKKYDAKHDFYKDLSNRIKIIANKLYNTSYAIERYELKSLQELLEVLYSKCVDDKINVVFADSCQDLLKVINNKVKDGNAFNKICGIFKRLVYLVSAAAGGKLKIPERYILKLDKDEIIQKLISGNFKCVDDKFSIANKITSIESCIYAYKNIQDSLDNNCLNGPLGPYGFKEKIEKQERFRHLKDILGEAAITSFNGTKSIFFKELAVFVYSEAFIYNIDMSECPYYKLNTSVSVEKLRRPLGYAGDLVEDMMIVINLVAKEKLSIKFDTVDTNKYLNIICKRAFEFLKSITDGKVSINLKVGWDSTIGPVIYAVTLLTGNEEFTEEMAYLKKLFLANSKFANTILPKTIESIRDKIMDSINEGEA